MFFNSFVTINFIPQDTKVIKIKNEIRPKLCNKKSEILLPYIPKKFFTFEEESPYTNEGSEGEYVTNEIDKAIPKEISNKPTNSKVRFFKKFVKLFKKFVFISNRNTYFLPLL